MYWNYLKIALRNIQRQKIYSFINISGLVLGLGFFILFSLLADFGFHFDAFHKNAERIFGVVQVLPSGNRGEAHRAIIPAPLIPELVKEFPEIEDATRFFPAGRMKVSNRNESFYENGILFVDSNFLSFFTFQIIAGDQENIFSEPNSVVLTEASSEKYFGMENPIGRSLTLANRIDVTVTGITKNGPENSSIRYDFLVSMETARPLFGWMDDWTVANQSGFVLLHEEYKPELLEEKFSAFFKKHYADGSIDTPKRLYLYPIRDFYLKSLDIDTHMVKTSPMQYVFIIIIAVLLLLVVSINFMNLSTARYVKRAKEVGLRKTIGANRLALVKQFLSESILMSILSLPFAILLYELLRPVFIALTGDDINISLWRTPYPLLLYFGVAVLLGLFAGSYPAFFLSAFKPVHVLKGELHSGKKGGRFRKILVVSQFMCSIILIVMTVVIQKQYLHLFNVDLGFDRDRVIAVGISDEGLPQLEPMKKELMNHPDIVTISSTASLPVSWDTERQVTPEGIPGGNAWTFNTYGVDYNFTECLGIQILWGRSFSHDYSDGDKCIINETAVHQLRWEDPLGKRLTLKDRKYTVIGIAKDFQFRDIHYPMSPIVLHLSPEHLNYMLVKCSPSSQLLKVLEYLREQWRVFIPDQPFEYVTLDDYFYRMYRGLEIGAKIMGTIGIIAIFLSCLGLLGLASYATERRTKEIGIRKVLGSSTTGIINSLIKEFLYLVIISNIIAIPLAYLCSKSLTQSITAYTTDIGFGVFILAAFITLITTAVAVTSQTLKAARANPVEALKYE